MSTATATATAFQAVVQHGFESHSSLQLCKLISLLIAPIYHLPLTDFIAALMKRRIGQGHPEEITVKVDDEPVVAYDWTDGIHSILSIFIPIDSGTIKEVCIVH